MRYAKALIALATAALIALQVALADGSMTAHDWITVTLAVLGAATVYTVANTPPTTHHPTTHHRPHTTEPPRPPPSHRGHHRANTSPHNEDSAAS